MMEEEVDIEDGEVVDYNPIPRPVCGPVGTTSMGYSDNSADENDSLDSNSGNDSDSPQYRPVKPKKKRMSVKSVHQTHRNKKYNVWSSELQESTLTEELVNCDVRQKSLDRSRDVESYDYRLAYTMDDQQDHNDDNFECESTASLRGGLKRRFDDRRSVKLRLGSRPTNRDDFDVRGSPRIIIDLNVTVENTNEEVASDIANKLCEEKDDLILKVVEIIGKEKAMDIFRETKKIEANGGLMVLNNSRRRTPGGVFLLLVKKDNDIHKEKLNMIFQFDRKKQGAMRRLSVSQSRKAKTEELRRSLSADGLLRERDLPALLNRADLQLEQHNKHIETDGETAVTNPPPSPATDGRENSSDGVPELSEQLSNRQLNCYDDDDFVDATCDNMDVF